MYFNKFPKIDYTFSNNQTIPVIDIFRKVSFSQESIQNSSIFINVINGQGKKPEAISYEYYNNPNFSWLLFMANQTVNPSFEWPGEYDAFLRNLNIKYNGFAYYLYDTTEIKVGDIAMTASANIDPQTQEVSLISVNTTSYALITNVNQEFRYFSGIIFEANITISDNVIFLRKNADGKYRPIEDANGKIVYRNIAKRELYLNAPRYFKSGSLIISPYRIFNPNNNQLTDFTASPVTTQIYEPETLEDTQTLFNTVLYSYINSNPIPVIEKVSIQRDEIELQNEKYKIKVIKPELIYDVMDLFEKTLNSNSIGRAQQIELFI